jgi:protocatechuate 3,4-dioxygenase beta subunit
MHDDDRPVGRLLSRREALAVLGAAGAAGIHAGLGDHAPLLAQVPACVVVPQQTQGPYFVDERLNRSDIRSDPADGKNVPGLDLDLALKVMQIGADGRCVPLVGALVDVWQCDAAGVYSDVQDARVGFDTRGKRFLRGQQTTDGFGDVRFTTIYPGWYVGRCVHIHFKVRTPAAGGRSATEFTSQLYFDEKVTDEVHAKPPYLEKGRRDTPNERDGIYRNGGAQLMLALRKWPRGYAGTFALALKTS